MKNSIIDNRTIFALSGSAFLVISLIMAFFIFQEITIKPKCNTDTCIGGDPKFFKCDKKVETLYPKTFKDLSVSIELRYSPGCNASWAKIAVPLGTIAKIPLGTTLYVKDSNNKKFGEFLVDKANVPDSREYFGNMGPTKNLKACAEFKNKSITICTN
jgi:Protein of unknown function (DUF2690)